MAIWNKDAVRRFDDTLQEAAHSGVPELVRLAQCIDHIMQASSAQARQAAKSFLGGQLSLGYHRQDSAAIQRHRHNVRGALLAQVLLNPTAGHTATSAQLLAMNAATLRQHVQGAFVNAQRPGPVINGPGQCQPNFNFAGRGGLRHEVRYVSSTGNMAHLCYMPTREMVWIRRVRIGQVTHHGVAPYGDGANFNRVLFAPWYPTTISATDSPASPHANRSTLDGLIADNHSHTSDRAIGPCSSGAAHPQAFVMFRLPLVDSEIEQEQRYQFNATGDAATWDRQNVAHDANVDPHWTDIPGGHFILKRHLFQANGGAWRLRFTKEDGQSHAILGDETVDVIAL